MQLPIRHTRYQGFIVKDRQALLIKHLEYATERSYWVIPGGGREDGESEEECVVREMREETNLDVKIVRLLLDEAAHKGSPYTRRKTYLCEIIAGTPSPGYEPEPEAAEHYSISEVKWFALGDKQSRDPELIQDSITYPQFVRATAAYLDGALDT